MKLHCPDCGQPNELADLASEARCGICGAGLAPAKPVAVDPAALARMLKDPLPLLVDFWAPWCAPCKAMAPQFATAARRLQGRVRLAKLDLQAHPAAGRRWQVQAVPTLILFRSGRELARGPGLNSADRLVSFCDRGLSAGQGASGRAPSGKGGGSGSRGGPRPGGAGSGHAGRSGRGGRGGPRH